MASERWMINSAYFQSQPSSFYSLRTYSAEQLEDVRKMAIRSTLPVLCWTEKVIVLIDYFQIYSIIWNAAQPYPWPFLWTQFSRPLLYVCFDFFSQTSDGALGGKSSNMGISKWGQMDGYLNYALSFAAVSIVLVASYLWFQVKHDEYGKDSFKYRDHITAAAVLLSYVLYLPCSLAVFRIFYCDAGDDRLGVDPSVDCWNWLHGIYLIPCVLCIAPLFFGLPYVLYRYAKQGIVYRNQPDHEKRIQMWELLYMLELDDFWLTAQLWVTSSFRYFGAYTLCHTAILKATLLIIFIFARNDLSFQASLMLFALAVYGTYYTFYKYPFRSLSTNIIFGACLAMHIVNMSFALANASGVKSAVMVASTEYLVLLVYNLFCYFLIFSVLVYTAVYPSETDWPSVRTLYRIYRDPDLLKKVAHWVEVIRESQAVKMDFLMAPVEIADINALEECIRMMRACWVMAKSCGSIFETPLNELLEELVYIHSSRLPQAIRRLDYWNRAYQHGVATKAFADRQNKHFMMNPRKRRMMVKLLAYRFLQGNKYKGAFSFENVAEYRKMMTDFEIEMRQRRKSVSLEGGEAHKGHTFSSFAKDATNLLRKSIGGDTTDADAEKAVTAAAAAHDEQQVNEALETDSLIAGPNGQKFDPIMVEEARITIERLQVRTEAALNKFHQAKKSLYEQLQTSGNKSTHNLLNSSTSSLTSGLVKVSTMELMKQAVDVDEQKDLEDLFHLWDDAIQLYEKEEFPGNYEQLNVEVENWYAYRGLVSQRLELIVQFLQEQEQLMQEIGGQEVIEEGDEDYDDDEEGQSRGGRLVSDDGSGQGGRLVSDDEASGGRLVSDEESGGRLVSDDED